MGRKENGTELVFGSEILPRRAPSHFPVIFRSIFRSFSGSRFGTNANEHKCRSSSHSGAGSGRAREAGNWTERRTTAFPHECNCLFSIPRAPSGNCGGRRVIPASQSKSGIVAVPGASHDPGLAVEAPGHLWLFFRNRVTLRRDGARTFLAFCENRARWAGGAGRGSLHRCTSLQYIAMQRRAMKCNETQ